MWTLVPSGNGSWSRGALRLGSRTRLPVGLWNGSWRAIGRLSGLCHNRQRARPTAIWRGVLPLAGFGAGLRDRSSSENLAQANQRACVSACLFSYPCAVREQLTLASDAPADGQRNRSFPASSSAPGVNSRTHIQRMLAGPVHRTHEPHPRRSLA